MANKRIVRLLRILTGTNSGSRDELFQLEGKLERFTHFWVLVVKSFIRNRCLVRASALSYSSLLALIPLLAVAISVTSSLLKTQGEEKIYQAIDKFVSNVMPPATVSTNAHGVSLNLTPAMSVLLTPTNTMAAGTNTLAVPTQNSGEAPIVSISAQKTTAKWIHQTVENMQSGALGMTGMVFLVFIAITMLARVEETFNDIWGVTRGRSWVWRIVLYWTTITLGPLLLAGALGLAGGSQLQTAHDFFKQMPFFGSVIFQFLPLVVLWFAFALVYQLVPNTKVKFSAAFIGGLMAGSLWHINNLFGFLYVSRVVTNSKIYGSLGLIPVFMAGLYFSWAILLFGAQVAYAFQNRAVYLQEKLAEHVNQRGREFVALRLMTFIGQRFQSGGRPATISEISAELNIPSRLAQHVLQTLLGARLVTETHGPETGYVPARPLENINAWQILFALRTGGGQELPVRDEVERAAVFGEFARIENAEREAAAAVTLLSLANRQTPSIGTIAAENPPPQNR